MSPGLFRTQAARVAISAVTLVGDWRKNGVKMIVIGLGAAAVGFLVGRLFHSSGA